MVDNKKITVVIADDDRAVQKLLKSTIEEYIDNAVCVLAFNGKEALESIQDYLPDIVILDLNMPVIGGLKALEKLRNFNADYYKNLPVIIYTSDQSISSKVDALNDGAALYLSKSTTSITDIIDNIYKLIK